MGRGCASAGLEYDRWPMNYLKRLRGAIGPAKVILVYTTAIVRDDAGRVLLQRRTDFEADAWSLPGGMLELGEAAFEFRVNRRPAADEGARAATNASGTARRGRGVDEARVGGEAEIVV